MTEQSTSTALITNAADYAGPPAVDALLAADFRVLVQDKTFVDLTAWAQFSRAHPGAELIATTDPASLIATAWNTAGRIDVIVSNDHYPAIHGPSDQALLDDLRQTLEVLVVEPFAMLKAAIPHLKARAAAMSS
jgi:NAD(P)-dependent dehydrogenase (short-subunit alcohol dehydrogenase family)